MAVGDTWIAKQINDGGNLIITVHCYRPDGSLADQFVIDEPNDALSGYLYILAIGNTVVVASGNYIYTRNAEGEIHNYKYGTADYPSRIKFANNTYFVFTYFELGDDYGAKIFSSNDGINWTLRHVGYATVVDEIPGAIYDIIYYAATGYYIIVAETYVETGYGVRLYRTTNFTSFEPIGNIDTRTSWIYLNEENGEIRYLNWRPSSTPAWEVQAVCEMTETGIRTVPFAIEPADTTLALPFLTQTLQVDLVGRPYVISTTAYTDYPNFYLWRRNDTNTAYEKYGSAFLHTNVSRLDRVSNYRVYNPTWGYVVLEYHNTGQGSVRVVSTNESGFVVPLDNSEDWHCCYLETDFDAPFWCEYDDCAEEPSDYVGAS